MIDDLAPSEHPAPPAQQAASITRPPLDPKLKDYSDSHDPVFCACEIDNALARNKIAKLGHYSAIIETHFPNAREIYDLLPYLAEGIEKAATDLARSKSSKLRELAATLRYRAELARKAIAKTVAS